jgi:cell division protein FtsW
VAPAGRARAERPAAAWVAASSRLPVSYHLVWAATLTLLAFGLVMIFSASSVVGLFRENPDRYFYFKEQAFAAGLGLFALVVISRLDYRRWRPWVLLLALVALLLLILVLIPGAGRGANGATRWLDLGFLSLQPAEVAKLATIGLGAHLLSLSRGRRRDSAALLWPFGGVVALQCALIMVQPDLGTTIVIALISLGLLWVAGLRAGHWFGIAALAGGAGMLLILAADYRRARFFAFLDPFSDPEYSGFQIIQSLIALGSGGWTGVGPGKSVQKFNYLPEAHTDMILAIVGEELGFLGLGLVIALFVLLTLSLWRLARRCTDPFGKYLVTGCLLLIAGQTVVNMGGVLAALPLTGVPLPFLSFARTNVMVMLAAVGVVLSVARFGPVSASLETPEDEGEQPGHQAAHPTSTGTAIPTQLEPSNVAYLDSRRRHRRSRRARPRAR